VGAEGAFEDVDAVGAGVAVPRVGDASPVDHLEDHHPGGRVAHKRNVLQVRLMYAMGNSSHVAVFVSTTVSSTGFMASVTAAQVGGEVGLVDITGPLADLGVTWWDERTP
jgi:hypothetical protein